MTSQGPSRLSHIAWGLEVRRSWPGSALPGLVDGTVLLAAWVALWTVFLLGVVEPAARLTASVPCVPAAQVERSHT